MEQLNPFSHSFVTIGHRAGSTYDGINQQAFEKLTRAAKSAQSGKNGHQVLLRAPGAGYGKSHLLNRLITDLSDWRIFSLNPINGTKIDAQSATEDIINNLLNPLPGGSGLTELDLISRKLLAKALIPIVMAGDVPCQDRDVAVKALRERPVETFDFHDEEALTARWTQDNFIVLGPRLALELANRARCSHRAASFWVEVFFKYSSTPPTAPLRNSELSEALGSAMSKATDTLRMERLSSLVNLIGLQQSCGFVIDETDGLSANSEAALGVTTFLQSLRNQCAGVFIILSVNNDIWESAFAPRLSNGAHDRLCETVIDLEPLSHEDKNGLIEELGGLHSVAITERLSGMDGILYPRRVMVEAAAVWEEEEERNPTPKTPGSGGNVTFTGFTAASVPPVPVTAGDAADSSTTASDSSESSEGLASDSEWPKVEITPSGVDDEGESPFSAIPPEDEDKASS